MSLSLRWNVLKGVCFGLCKIGCSYLFLFF
jgi:hypothetical protein